MLAHLRALIDMPVVLNLISFCKGNMCIDYHKLPAHLIDVPKNWKNILRIEMVENPKKENDIKLPIRLVIDLADIILLKLQVGEPQSARSTCAFIHPLSTSIYRKDLSTPKGGFNSVDTLAARQVENAKLFERHLREVRSDLHHTPNFHAVGIPYLKDSMSPLRPFGRKQLESLRVERMDRFSCHENSANSLKMLCVITV